ncbi:MAG: fluoride efflux transporter CrcB [Spirochaetaceae bacterium]|nr:fluoride efflux transporter CrcB [Spirochaetaceae bacterium]
MSDLLRDGVLVGIGGFFGALGRFLLSGWIGARVEQFPAGTLAVNVIGSLAIGFLAGAAGSRLLASGAVRLLVMAGFLGAFTTFSAFSYESVQLWQTGRWQALLANAGLNVGGCLLATAAGMAAARMLPST